MAEVLWSPEDTAGWQVRDNDLKRYYVSPQGKVYRIMRQNTTFPGKPDLIIESNGKWGTGRRTTWLKELGPQKAKEALPSRYLTPRTVETQAVKKTRRKV